MNFYPIYRNKKLLPWIKWWLIKGNKTKPILPSEYQMVEWIGTNGAQRLDTGEQRDVINTYRYVGSFNYSNIQARQLNGVQGGFYIGVVNGYYQVESGGTTHSNIEAIADEFIDFDVFFDTTERKAKFTINNIYEEHNAAFSNTPAGAHIYIFSLNNDVLPSQCKMKFFKLYKNDELIRYFIPCYRKSDEEIGMYDIIGKNFYTNSGTGTFTKGVDV